MTAGLRATWRASSKLAIYAAIAANVAIATTKLAVASYTGSSAMLSEGIHSSVDSFNGVLLLVGILTMAGYFQMFAEPYVMTQGGPLQSTVSVLYLMYEEGFKWWNLGNASAVAFLLFAIMTVVTTGLLWFARRRGVD